MPKSSRASRAGVAVKWAGSDAFVRDESTHKLLLVVSVHQPWYHQTKLQQRRRLKAIVEDLLLGQPKT